jgi:hypothetical protein
MMIPIHFLPIWGYPFTNSLLVRPVCFFTFDDTHFLLPFQWYPFTSSPLMTPIFYFPFNDTHLLLHLWWHPFILMTPIGSWGSNSRNLFFKSITQRHRVCKVKWWVLKKHFLSFHHKRQDENFCEFCVPQGVFFVRSSDTKDIFPHVLGQLRASFPLRGCYKTICHNSPFRLHFNYILSHNCCGLNLSHLKAHLHWRNAPLLWELWVTIRWHLWDFIN